MTTADKTELKKQIASIIDKSRRSIQAAKRMIDEEDFDFAASRLYYAVFYAMQAMLLLKDISP